MVQSTENACEFWHFETKNNKTVAVIDKDKLIDFCSQRLGYYNYVEYSGIYILVKVERKSVIKETRPEDLKQDIKRYIRDDIKQEKVWAAFASLNIVTDNFISLLDTLPSANFNISKKGEAYFFYQNGVVAVNNNGCKITPYEEFSGTVWKEQIRKRDFIKAGNEWSNAVFNAFLKNVSGKDDNRYLSLISIIGYLLHPYKDSSFTKAVILLDENVDFSGAAHGGTGKSLISKALEQITSVCCKDGKKYNPNEIFGFDDIKPYHRILYFDDVKKNFNFEEFYPFITGQLKVNRKYRDSINIPFDLTPKLLISSNYMIKGSGGSDARRKIEFEIAPYYSTTLAPKDEFGHIFFEEWDVKEWILFDNLMLRCVWTFINNGITMPPMINLKENKLKMDTNPDFIVFIDQVIEIEVPVDKTQLLEEFKRLCPDHRNLSGIAFKKWIDIWAEDRNYLADHYKSNGYAMLRVSTKSSS